MNTFYTSERHVLILLALLKAHGIRKVIASPGTTNIALVASMQQDPFFQMYSAADERSAAYMACGLATESGEPVILSCTGATASRNYLPGLTEAYYRKLPVLAITSTHPIYNISHHVPQMVDRSVVAKDVVSYSVYLPIAKDENDLWICERKINQALLALKRNGCGPVHINLESSCGSNFSVKSLPEVRVINRITICDRFPDLPNGRIAIFIGTHRKWKKEEIEAIDNFCASHDAVVFCDQTSSYKGKNRILYSLVMSQIHYHSPLSNVNLLIHIGEVSGDYYSLGISAQQVWRISEDGEVRDTFGKLRYVFEMPEDYFFSHYIIPNTECNSFWNECYNEYQKMYQQIPELPFSNIWIAKQLAPRLPENASLHLGILNSLRAWNFFEIPISVSSFCNVGGFGIDGNMSSLIGASLFNPNKIYFGVIGDLAFFYDMNVLGNHHIGKNVRILLINNGRGTEFRNYNHIGNIFKDDADAFIAAAGHYGNKSRKLVKHYAEDLGFEYLSASTKEEFDVVCSRFISVEMTNKPMLFEVFTNSTDESETLQIMQTLMVESRDLFKEKLIDVSKKILGTYYHKASWIYHKIK